MLREWNEKEIMSFKTLKSYVNVKLQNNIRLLSDLNLCVQKW